MDEQWSEYESPDLRLRYPAFWRTITQMRGCRLMLLAPDGPSEFRSSLTFTDEPASDEGLDVILEGLLPEMDRFFTDYTSSEIRDLEVDSRPAKLIRGTYRHGRTTVGLDQWMVQTPHRLFSISASYDRDSDAGFFEVANDVVATLRLEAHPDAPSPGEK